MTNKACSALSARRASGASPILMGCWPKLRADFNGRRGEMGQLSGRLPK